MFHAFADMLMAMHCFILDVFATLLILLLVLMRVFGLSSIMEPVIISDHSFLKVRLLAIFFIEDIWIFKQPANFANAQYRWLLFYQNTP